MFREDFLCNFYDNYDKQEQRKRIFDETDYRLVNLLDKKNLI